MTRKYLVIDLHASCDEPERTVKEMTTKRAATKHAADANLGAGEQRYAVKCPNGREFVPLADYPQQIAEAKSQIAKHVKEAR